MSSKIEAVSSLPAATPSTSSESAKEKAIKAVAARSIRRGDDESAPWSFVRETPTEVIVKGGLFSPMHRISKPSSVGVSPALPPKEATS